MRRFWTAADPINHKHEWKLVDKTILESPITKMLRGNRRTFENLKLTGPAAQEKDRVILVFICKVCGDKSVEER